jgi:serine protease Do
LLFAPLCSAAQSQAQGGDNAGRDLTQETQSEINIDLPSFAPLVDRVVPTVVNISVELKEQVAGQDEGNTGEGTSRFGQGGTPFDQFLHRFFEQPLQFRNPAEKVLALGSGFIIDPRGNVVTNNHVVADADKVTVIFQDDNRHVAKVIGRDEETDIALLKIDTDRKLPFVTWGNSDEARVGDWVVAVGNPFGLGGTVTTGIVSALGRNINEGPYDDFLQIDAPINRGNSGGPTFDLHGQVIGINTAIYSPSGGSVGIGFAVPSNTAKYVIDQLEQHGRVTWGWLGVAIQSITPSIAKGLGINPEQSSGALVASVIPDSPAARAGLKSGDVITAASGHEIKTVHDVSRLAASAPVGSGLNLTILRNGKEQTIEATIGEMPKKVAAAEQSGKQSAAALGMELAPLTPQLRSQLHEPKDVNGVVVDRIASDSLTPRIGLTNR